MCDVNNFNFIAYLLHILSIFACLKHFLKIFTAYKNPLSTYELGHIILCRSQSYENLSSNFGVHRGQTRGIHEMIVFRKVYII